MLERTLWGYISNFIQNARHCPQILVQALRVAEMQEILDQQQAVEQTKSEAGGLKYRDRCYEEIRKAIEARHGVLIEKLVVEDLEAALKEASAISRELPDILEYVAPCFLPRCEIFKYYLHLYTERFIQMLRRLGDRASKFFNLEILKVLGWLVKFQEELIQFGVEKGSAAQCGHFSGAMDPLMDDYVDRMQIFMRTCNRNIMEADKKNPPKRSNDRRLYTPAGVVLFQILREQVLQVGQENSTDVMLYRISLPVIQIMDEFQAAHQKRIEELVIQIMNRIQAAQLQKRIEELTADDGLQHLYAMVNNNYSCHELALELSNRVMNARTPYHAEQVHFENSCKGLLEGGKETLLQAVKVIFEDPGVKELT